MRASLIATNFTGGELSPAVALGRVDAAKYNNGARRLENCVITVQGGAKRRPGTRYIAPTKNETKKSRLIDFVFNRGQAYMLEMGDGYIRFFKDRAQISVSAVPYEVPAPYTEGQLPSVNYVQKADTAFFVHESVFPFRLQRFGDASWGLAAVPFITPPFEEQGHYPAPNITFSSITPGAATVTAASAAFLKSDVGRRIAYLGGTAEITAFTSATVVTANVITPMNNFVLPGGFWNLTGTPLDSIWPSSAGKVGETISLSANFTAYGASKAVTQTDGSLTNFTVVVPAHGWVKGDTVVLSDTNGFDGTRVIENVPASDRFSFSSTGFASLHTTGGSARKLLGASTDAQVWRPEDVGKWVTINGGLVRITAYFDSSLVNAVVLRELTSEIPATKNSWVLEGIAWNAQQGYPRAVTINRQRLLFAGSPGYPQHMWASEIQDYLNFSFGTDDDQAFRFELDGPRNSPIRHLAPSRQLLVLTEADEMSIKGGQEKPITPTNIQKTDESTAGSSSVRPVKIGNEILFVQAAGRKINAAAYRYDIDGFSSPDRTVFASHITSSGVTQLAHQKEPDSMFFAVRADGQMAVCAYDIEQEVVGWARWITDGKFEAIATIPTATGEDAYTVVQRTINGAARRYVEVFDADMLVDCGISGTNPAGQTTWAGLGHLEGETVQAWADGAYLGEYLVVGGSVTLSRAAKSVQIGLGFNCLVEMLQIEVGGNGQTAQGSQVHVNEVIIRVLETSAALINGVKKEFRRFGPDLLDQPPPSYTGDVRGITLQDEIFRTNVVIEQPYPLPFHLLDVIRKVTIDG